MDTPTLATRVDRIERTITAALTQRQEQLDRIEAKLADVDAKLNRLVALRHWQTPRRHT